MANDMREAWEKRPYPGPIARVGWQKAAEIVSRGGRLLRYEDGHAEVIEGTCAVAYLTRRSLQLYDLARPTPGD